MAHDGLSPQQEIALDELRLFHGRVQSARDRLLNKLYTVLGIASLVLTFAASVGGLPGDAWALLALAPALAAVILVIGRAWTARAYSVPFTTHWQTLQERHVKVSVEAAFQQVASNYCDAIDEAERANQKLGRTVNWALVCLLVQLVVVGVFQAVR